MTLLVAVDPGKMTGVALFAMRGEDPELLESHEFLRDELEVWLEDKLLSGWEDIQVVAERYVIGKADSPWSLRYLGVLSYLSRKGGWGEPVIQTPAAAKSFAPDSRLKALGYWHRGGKGHANDAIRHAILYMVNIGYIPDKKLISD